MTEDARTALAQAALQLTFLASQAWDRAHAIGLTLVRLAATKRRLLEWETAAASAERGHGRGGGARAFVMEMIASPLDRRLCGLLLVAIDAAGGARGGGHRCCCCGSRHRSSPTP